MLEDSTAIKEPEIEVPAGKMHVKVYAPFKTYFNGIANSISAVNDTGPFDILPKHHNFMTLLSPCDIVVRSDQGEETVTISRGIMHVKADRVIVFLDV
jgi:F0F1-type ATP synthase epsilon subunit